MTHINDIDRTKTKSASARSAKSILTVTAKHAVTVRWGLSE